MTSRLFPYFLMCWKNGTITEQQLASAVEKSYITAEEKEQIVAAPR